MIVSYGIKLTYAHIRLNSETMSKKRSIPMCTTDSGQQGMNDLYERVTLVLNPLTKMQEHKEGVCNDLSYMGSLHGSTWLRKQKQ